MKMKNFANIAFFQSWAKIFNAELPPLTFALKIKEVNDYLDVQNKKFIESRLSIINKYCEKDEKGQIVLEGDDAKISQENLKPAEKELIDLYETELSPSSPHKFSLEVLEKEGVKLSALDLTLLEGIVEVIPAKAD